MKPIAMFKVTFPVPPGATLSDCRYYVMSAVKTWRGSLKPPDRDPEDPSGDPMFNLDPDQVKVTYAKRDRHPTNKLLARIYQLESALRPFADAAPLYDHASNDHIIAGGITVGELRLAKALLEGV
jgi:hypothetical protein